MELVEGWTIKEEEREEVKGYGGRRTRENENEDKVMIIKIPVYKGQLY